MWSYCLKKLYFRYNAWNYSGVCLSVFCLCCKECKTTWTPKVAEETHVHHLPYIEHLLFPSQSKLGSFLTSEEKQVDWHPVHRWPVLGFHCFFFPLLMEYQAVLCKCMGSVYLGVFYPFVKYFFRPLRGVHSERRPLQPFSSACLPVLRLVLCRFCPGGCFSSHLEKQQNIHSTW